MILETRIVWFISTPGHEVRINMDDFDPRVHMVPAETQPTGPGEVELPPVVPEIVPEVTPRYTQEDLQTLIDTEGWQAIKALAGDEYQREANSWEAEIPFLLEHLNG